jgi:hypothetical protein
MVGDYQYCVTCKNGFPDAHLLFKVCTPFPKSKSATKMSIPPMEDLVQKGLPQEYVDLLKKRAKAGLTREEPEKVNSFDNCLWGTVSGFDKQYYNCFKCKPGYTNHAGGCILTTIEGCLEIDIYKKKCIYCDVYSGYYGRSNAGTCTKDNTSLNIELQ